MSKSWPAVVSATLTALVLSLAAETARGQQEDAASRGREIAAEVDRRARGFGDYQVRLEMILQDRGGRQTRRELDLAALEVSPSEERWLALFLSPADIRGTGLLTYSHADAEDEQWLYLPSLKRTKRISASGRSAPFMGSEFAYEDLAPTYASQYEYVYLREEGCEQVRCFVLERYPSYEGTGYRRQQLWIDVAEYRVLRIDSWDLRDRPLKTLTLSGYQRYLGRVWRPSEAVVVNRRTDESTILRWHDYRFATGLTEDDFSRTALARVR